MRQPYTALLIIATILFAALPPCRAQEGNLDDRIKKPVSDSIRLRQATQRQEEKWREEKQVLVTRYEQLEAELNRLTARKQALAEKTAAARSRIAAKQQQLADIEQIQTQIEPLIGTLIEDLQLQVDRDPPFLPEERRKRLARLERLHHDPDVAVSEKFRKVMEALQIEAEYGNTIEVYQQTIRVAGSDMLVNIFRLGRISLFFQSLDQRTCGFYNVAEAAWKTLPASYNRNIQTAIDIGAKRRPVELLTLPLGRIQAP